MKTITAAAMTALFVAGCSDMGMSDPETAGSAASDTQTAASMPSDMTPTEAMPFVTMAGASDLYEIQSSQLAMTKSQDSGVREFALMMVAHHSKTTQDVTAAAQTAGITPPPPQLMPMQADMIAQLQPLSGAEFDRMYKTQQVRAHEMALALHSNYAKSGDTPALRTAAQGAVPIIQQHLTRIRQMS